MCEPVALEIRLTHDQGNQYRVQGCLYVAGTPTALPPESAPTPITTFDLDALGGMASDPAIYGEALTKSLFCHQVIRDLLVDARVEARKREVPLRLQLVLGKNAVALHGLRWETLRDPAIAAFLTTNQNILFSRYLDGSTSEIATLHTRSHLRALVAVAAPKMRSGKRLDPVDVNAEIAHAQLALGSLSPMLLCRLGRVEPACVGWPTVDNLLARLGAGCDILYLACHGKLINDMPKLWLETHDGYTDVVPAEEEVLSDGTRRPGFIAQLAQLPSLPQLVVLASCQSAGKGKEWADQSPDMLMSIGPRLAQIGVPAVVAMQGNVTMGSVDLFMPTFLAELQKDGVIDRAFAAARSLLVRQNRPDWWMPVLFMCLKDGQLWLPATTENALPSGITQHQLAGGQSTIQNSPQSIRGNTSVLITQIQQALSDSSIVDSPQQICIERRC